MKNIKITRCVTKSLHKRTEFTLKKKLLPLFATVIVAVTLAACGSDSVSTDSSPPPPPVSQNDTMTGDVEVAEPESERENVRGHIIDIQGGWIYYTCTGANRNNIWLRRIRTDGSSDTALIEGTQHSAPGNITIVDDWIYFSNPNESGRLYRVRTDGTEKALIYREAFSDIAVVDEWAFYLVKGIGQDTGFKKIRTDGSERTDLLDDLTMPLVSNIIPLGDYVYFTTSVSFGVYYLCRIHIDSSEYERLWETTKIHNSIYTIVDGWVYYHGIGTESNIIFRARIEDGSDVTTLAENVSVDANGFTLTGGWIFFSNTIDNRYMDKGIYRMLADGSELEQINDEPISNLHVYDDQIYYTNVNDNRYIYKMQIDGSGNQLLN
jgi:hypothetical protein